MEQLAAEEGMTLLLMDGDRFQGGRRELNDCILCTALYDAFSASEWEKKKEKGCCRIWQTALPFSG